MNSIEKTAKSLIDQYRQTFLNIGYSVSDVQKEVYSYSMEVSEKNEKLKVLVYFGKKGIKPGLQGNNSANLFKSLQSIIFGEKLFNEETGFIEPDVYIGTDESGKGDYFGPLVTAGVLINADSKSALKKIGVRDSKELSDFAIKQMANQIRKIAKDKFSIVRINPEKYNSLYSKIGNVNNLLGWAHARAIENILDSHKVDYAVSDKFGNPKTILNSLMDKGKTINLHQEIKAEKYTAVAAASILARSEVINWFEINSKKFGIVIPKGASSQVDSTALKLKNQIGEEELKKLVKVHFKTSLKIF